MVSSFDLNKVNPSVQLQIDIILIDRSGDNNYSLNESNSSLMILWRCDSSGQLNYTVCELFPIEIEFA